MTQESAEKETMLSLAKSNNLTPLEILDISMTMDLDHTIGAQHVDFTETAQGSPIKLSLELPEAAKNYEGLKIIRTHKEADGSLSTEFIVT